MDASVSFYPGSKRFLVVSKTSMPLRDRSRNHRESPCMMCSRRVGGRPYCWAFTGVSRCFQSLASSYFQGASRWWKCFSRQAGKLPAFSSTGWDGPVPGRRLFALPAVRAFPGLRVEIFQTGKSRYRWICSSSKELIAFCAANIVSSVDATKNGAYRKDISRRLPPRKDTGRDKKTSLGAMSFVETFADLVIQLSSRFWKVSRCAPRIDERSG